MQNHTHSVSGFVETIHAHAVDFDVADQSCAPLTFMDKRDLTDYRRDLLDCQDDLLVAIRQEINPYNRYRQILFYRFLQNYRLSSPLPIDTQSLNLRKHINQRIRYQLRDNRFALDHFEHGVTVWQTGQNIIKLISTESSIEIPNFSKYFAYPAITSFKDKFLPLQQTQQEQQEQQQDE